MYLLMIHKLVKCIKKNIIFLIFVCISVSSVTGVVTSSSSNPFGRQAYSINYRITNEIVPVRIEFDEIRQLEYVMNLYSTNERRNSITLYDFNQAVVIYKELTAKECYIQKMTHETLETERQELERKKNTIIDSSASATLFVSQRVLSEVNILNLAGVRGTRFCRGMNSYLITARHTNRHRTKRQAGHFIQRSYGHYGQHSINYAHYGHETYTIGSFGERDNQFQHGKGISNNSAAVNIPIFILLPLQGQSSIDTQHSTDYKLKLPTGEIKSTFNYDNQQRADEGDNRQILGYALTQNPKNFTQLPQMVIIPGVTHNIIPLHVYNDMQKNASQNKASTDIHVKTSDGNTAVVGKAQFGDKIALVSGNNSGRGRLTAYSHLNSNGSSLYSNITANGEGATAKTRVSTAGRGDSESRVNIRTLTGETWAGSLLQNPEGRANVKILSNKEGSKAESKAKGDLSNTKTQTNVTATKYKSPWLRGEVNASTNEDYVSGMAKASLKTDFSGLSSLAKSLGQYQRKNGSQSLTYNYSSPSVKPHNKPSFVPTYRPYTSERMKPRSERHRYNSQVRTSPHKGITSSFRKDSSTVNRSKLDNITLVLPIVTYPNITIENIKYPYNFLYPQGSHKTRNYSTLQSNKFNNSSYSRRVIPYYSETHKKPVPSVYPSNKSIDSRKGVPIYSETQNRPVPSIYPSHKFINAGKGVPIHSETQSKPVPSIYPPNKFTNAGKGVPIHSETQSKPVPSIYPSNKFINAGKGVPIYSETQNRPVPSIYPSNKFINAGKAFPIHSETQSKPVPSIYPPNKFTNAGESIPFHTESQNKPVSSIYPSNKFTNAGRSVRVHSESRNKPVPSIYQSNKFTSSRKGVPIHSESQNKPVPSIYPSNKFTSSRKGVPTYSETQSKPVYPTKIEMVNDRSTNIHPTSSKSKLQKLKHIKAPTVKIKPTQKQWKSATNRQRSSSPESKNQKAEAKTQNNQPSSTYQIPCCRKSSLFYLPNLNCCAKNKRKTPNCKINRQCHYLYKTTQRIKICKTNTPEAC